MERKRAGHSLNRSTILKFMYIMHCCHFSRTVVYRQHRPALPLTRFLDGALPCQRPPARSYLKCSSGKVKDYCFPSLLLKGSLVQAQAPQVITQTVIVLSLDLPARRLVFLESLSSTLLAFVIQCSHLTMALSAPSLLEYARHHGLVADHHELDLDGSTIFDIPRADQPNHQSSLAPLIPLPREGKLRLKKSELLLLAASIKNPPLPAGDQILPDQHRIHRLKHEVPLVAGKDAESQCISKRPGLDLEDLGVFQDCTDGPTKFLGLASEWHEKLSNEKLQVTKKDLMYLHHALQAPYSAEECERVLKDALPSHNSVSTSSSSAINQTRSRSPN